MSTDENESELSHSVLQEDDYYAFFNLDREATPDEINNAYRRFSRIYHPDKHTNPSEKTEAEMLFSKTKKRAIYDSVGVQGLETEGWEIVQRTKTPQEIREEYERLARERNERRLHQRTHPRGTLTVNINATDIFTEYEEFYDELDAEGWTLPVIEVSGMSLSQSIEVPLTLKDTATLSGSLSTHNGTGSGTFNLATRRLLSSKTSLECSCFAGNGPGLGLKGFRRITQYAFATCDAQLHLTSTGLKAGLESVLGYQLSSSTIGYFTWRAGMMSSMSTSVVKNMPNYSTGFNVYIAMPNSYAMLHYSRKMLKDELKLKFVLKIGTLGSYFEYGVEKKVTEHTRLTAAVGCGYPSGIVLKVKIIRASQIYSFPIHLCEDLAGAPLFYATVTPLVVYLVVKKLIIDPIVRDQKSRDIERQRELNKTRLAEKRREAKAAVNLMQATFSRIRSEEEKKKGLVIIKAFFGKAVSLSAPDLDLSEDVIDVTVPLQCLVKDSKLVLHDSSKSQLAGFFDPCVGEDKYLSIQYLFHSHLHEAVIGDRDKLRIPKQSHRVTT
ncbi:hypothetical protein M8J76_001693 [Diaphorina citri]|nr:hypothetical protein M8J75_002872 [Diaphorina citri]KAI5726385.1 hypothetical protein M8J76_001693 [Diaphorina citri]